MPQKPISFTGAGAHKLLDVAATDRHRVFDYLIRLSGAGTIEIEDEAGTSFGIYVLPAAGEVKAEAMGDGAPRFVAVGDLILTVTGAIDTSGHFTYAPQ